MGNDFIHLQKKIVQNFPSKKVGLAVEELAKLPGIGQRTAMRLALYLLKQDEKYAESLGNAIISMRKEIRYCRKCHNISDHETCDICADSKRDHSLVCVVEDVRDVMAIENTSQYRGVYHVLGGIISPMEGLGPEDLTITQLIKRIKEDSVKEIIMALPTTIEGDTTNYYIHKQIKNTDVKMSTLARGVSIGNDLEYADEVTLGRSIVNRQPYDESFSD